MRTKRGEAEEEGRRDLLPAVARSDAGVREGGEGRDEGALAAAELRLHGGEREAPLAVRLAEHLVLLAPLAAHSQAQQPPAHDLGASRRDLPLRRLQEGGHAFVVAMPRLGLQRRCEHGHKGRRDGALLLHVLVPVHVREHGAVRHEPSHAHHAVAAAPLRLCRHGLGQRLQLLANLRRGHVGGQLLGRGHAKGRAEEEAVVLLQPVADGDENALLLVFA